MLEKARESHRRIFKKIEFCTNNDGTFPFKIPIVCLSN